MKNFKLKLVLLSILTFGLTFTACNGDKSGQTEQAVKQGKEFTSAYICPMHCEGSGSETPGQCPDCGMDYVKNEKNKSEDTGHEGHNH